ncbi:hypothetical protein SAY86_014281 [Trapa natans]|uniref:BED-type domain-containing protein n=1 Tax=Trapa natans TaxID=22666 RepID=A0AAN7L0B8_TRANT|nr:hypothetical protein SAY86_014281 [Trapa natans]
MGTPTRMDIEVAIAPLTHASPIDSEAPLGTGVQNNGRRRKKSVVWEHFTIENVGPEHTRACCKHCKKSFSYINGSKLAGTSHLKRHIALGICPMSSKKVKNPPFTPASASKARDDEGHSVGPVPKKRCYRSSPGFAFMPIDQERCNQEIAKMIILHEYPLHIVEDPGFVDFVRTLHPHYNMVSFNTVQGDCVGLYLKEKQKLRGIINSIPGHVNLTLDLWTSNQTIGYIVLSGHFIDNDWNLHRRVLNVVMVPSPESDHAFNQAVVACISDWSLDNRLFTLTLHQSVSDEGVLGNLREFLSAKNPHVLNGQLVVGKCFARVLSSLAQEAITSMEGTVKRIRDSVKYVKTSDANDEKFAELKQHLQVPSTKELSIDDQTKWNTTYNMLVAACELKEVFSCFDASDPGYKISPSMDDWKQIETLCSYLKMFFDAASILAVSPHPTVNVFFPEVSKIQLELMHAASSEDMLVRNLVKPLQKKFDKYWKECCLILAVAVVMDPRYKMKLVEFTFLRTFEDDAEDWIRIVDDGIHELYYDYVTSMSSLSAAPVVNGDENIMKAGAPDGGLSQGVGTTTVQEEIQISHDDTVISFGDGLSDFDVYISEITGNQDMKSELDQYLEESLLPRVQEFDVLGWWKANQVRYPLLSKMTADILSIPVCTLPPESVFATRSRKINNYQSLLRPVTLEALVCAKDWLQYKSSREAPNARAEV